MDFNALWWNARSVIHRQPELVAMLGSLSPTFVALTETWLRPTLHLQVPGYVVHRADRSAAPRGGVALLVAHGVRHYRRSLPAFDLLEAAAVRVTGLAFPFTVVVAYAQPNRRFPAGDLDKIFRLDASVLLLGDLNCKNVLWRCATTDFRGRGLEAFARARGLRISAPITPTHFPARQNYRASVVDLAVHTRDLQLSAVTTLTALDSDHLPVVAVLTLPFRPQATSPQAWDYKRARWKLFKRELDASLRLDAQRGTPDEVDAAVARLEAAILLAAEKAIPRRPVQARGPPFPPALRRLIRDRNRARGRWQAQRSNDARDAYYSLRRDTKSRVEAWNAARQLRYLESLDLDSGSLWDKARKLRRQPSQVPPLRGPAGFLEDPSDKAEALAEHFHATFSVAPMAPRRPGARGPVNPPEEHRFVQCPMEELSGRTLTSPKEVARLVAKVRARTAPGFDGISAPLVRSLSWKGIIFLTAIINDVLRLGFFPTRWRTAIIVPVPRRDGAPDLVSSYRPIALLSLLSKLAERILMSRLLVEVDVLRLLPDHQFGFRKRHSALHAAAAVVDDVTKAFCDRDFSMFVCLDLAKAYDSVPHSALLLKLRRFGISERLLCILHSFLQARTFRVRVSGELSDVRTVPAGVPQGALLSPLLFILYVADMPEPEGSRLYQYADDTALLLRGPRLLPLYARTQASLRRLQTYFQDCSMRANPGKSTAICLAKRRTRPLPALTMAGAPIPWLDTVRYLGLYLDRTLTWGPQVARAASNAQLAFRPVRPLLSHRCAVPQDLRMRLWRAIILPVLTYGAVVWAHMSPSVYRPLTSVYNRHLRWVLGYPITTPVKHLCTLAGLPSLRTLVAKLATAFYAKVTRNTNPRISQIGDYAADGARLHRRIKDFSLYEPP